MSVLFFLGRAQDTVFKPTLKIGDPAPSMTIEKWLKGKPQMNLNDGKVHVVEFWATWCGPCILGMPHMSKMAEEYKDVSFVGVTVSEKTDDVSIPQKFVDVSRNMMAYNIAYDKPKGTMWKDWLYASGRNGIPVAFVVRKDGRIGWVGHPLMGLEDAIVLARKDQLTESAAEFISKHWIERKANGEKFDQSLKLAIKEGRIEDALRYNDSVVANWPFNIAIVSGKKYALLTAKDPKAARDFGESLLVTQGNAPAVLKNVATTIFEGSDARVRGEVKVKVTGAPDYELAKKLLLKALECSVPDRQTDALFVRIKEFEDKNNNVVK